MIRSSIDKYEENVFIIGPTDHIEPEQFKLYDINTKEYYFYLINTGTTIKEIKTYSPESDKCHQLKWKCHPLLRMLYDSKFTSFKRPIVFRSIVPVTADTAKEEIRYFKSHGFLFKVIYTYYDEYTDIKADLGKILIIIEAIQLNCLKEYSKKDNYIEVNYDNNLYHKYIDNFIKQIEKIVFKMGYTGNKSIDLCDQGACITFYNIDTNPHFVTSLEEDLWLPSSEELF